MNNVNVNRGQFTTNAAFIVASWFERNKREERTKSTKSTLSSGVVTKIIDGSRSVGLKDKARDECSKGKDLRRRWSVQDRDILAIAHNIVGKLVKQIGDDGLDAKFCAKVEGRGYINVHVPSLKDSESSLDLLPRLVRYV